MDKSGNNKITYIDWYINIICVIASGSSINVVNNGVSLMSISNQLLNVANVIRTVRRNRGMIWIVAINIDTVRIVNAVISSKLANVRTIRGKWPHGCLSDYKKHISNNGVIPDLVIFMDASSDIDPIVKEVVCAGVPTVGFQIDKSLSYNLLTYNINTGNNLNVIAMITYLVYMIVTSKLSIISRRKSKRVYIKGGKRNIMRRRLLIGRRKVIAILYHHSKYSCMRNKV
jgi:hypothetical protein